MTQRQLSILHVLGSRAPRYGGPPRMAELCAALGALGHQVELASTTLDGPYDLCVPTGVAAEEDGFSAIVFPVAHPRGYTFSPSLSRWLWRNIGRFDIVHVHGIYLFVTLAVARICRARGMPYVMHPHGALTAYHRAHNSGRKRVYELALERSHARHAATLIWESERERAEAVDAGWPEGSVVWSGVHVPTLDPDAVRRRGEIVFLGRVSAKKGVDTLVEAFARVVAVRSDARLRIIGPDEDVAVGRSRAVRRSLGSQTTSRLRALRSANRRTMHCVAPGSMCCRLPMRVSAPQPSKPSPMRLRSS